MESTARAALFTSLFVGMLGGCGGGAGAGVDAGGASDALLSCPSDRTRRIAELTTTSDRQAFCDCVAAVGGGYGQSKQCDGGIVLKTTTDQATCVADFGTNGASCAATIGDA